MAVDGEKIELSGLQFKLGLYKLKPQTGTFLVIEYNGIKHHFFVNYKPEMEGCVIFGTGAVSKKKVSIPYFDRIKWSESIPSSTIYYFDSTLFLNDETCLGWLYGTNDRWYMKEVEEILKILLKKMKLNHNDTLFVGSSGGGYTSCALATLFKSSALVYNPQLICLNWSEPHNELLRKVLKEGEELIEERLNLNKIIEKNHFCPELHICQNVVAIDDLTTQIVPFISELSEEYHLGNKVKIDFYANEKGHSGMVDTLKTIEMIKDDLAKLLKRNRS